MRKLSEEKLASERERLELMKSYERQYEDSVLVCGIDEAGRGPLAGPVVAGAVILPRDCEILFLNDSKKLSEKRREELFLEIQEKAVSFAVGVVDRSGSMRSIFFRPRMRPCGWQSASLPLFRRCF